MAAPAGGAVAYAADRRLGTNPSFEAQTTGCIGNTTNNTSISGWLLSLYSYNCLVVTNGAVSGKDGNNYATIFGGGKLETAPTARAAVSAGTSYTLSALISKSRATAGISSPARLRIVFYNGNTNTATQVGQLDSGDLLAGAATSGFGTYTVSGAAPTGATYAAAVFEFSRGGWPNEDTASFQADNFNLSAASSSGGDAITNGGFGAGTGSWAVVSGNGVATSVGRNVHSGSTALQSAPQQPRLHKRSRFSQTPIMRLAPGAAPLPGSAKQHR